MTAQIVAAVIGGSGFTRLLEPVETVDATTPYGAPSAPVTICELDHHRIAFLPRHGEHHQYAPHLVNYRANLWALHDLGVRHVFGPFAAGALDPTLCVGDLVLPDQLVDRTWGRADTYHDDFADGPFHAAFADPYHEGLRQVVLHGSTRAGIEVLDRGTVVVIQGPRFGTRAESTSYASQGWQLVNMTQYPEAVLARELDLCYAGIGLVTDADSESDAGKGVTQDQVFQAFDRHVDRLRRLVLSAVAELAERLAAGSLERPEDRSPEAG